MDKLRTDRGTEKQRDRQRQAETGEHTKRDRQRGRQRDRETDGEAGRETDRKSDRPTELTAAAGDIGAERSRGARRLIEGATVRHDLASCRHFSGRLTHELCADCLRRFCARVFCRFFSVISPALPRNFYTREIAPVTAVVCAAMAALAQAPWHLPLPAGTEREGRLLYRMCGRGKIDFPNAIGFQLRLQLERPSGWRRVRIL